MGQRAGVDYLHNRKTPAGTGTLNRTVLSLVVILVGSHQEVPHFMTNSVKIWILMHDRILSLSLHTNTLTNPMQQKRASYLVDSHRIKHYQNYQIETNKIGGTNVAWTKQTNMCYKSERKRPF